MKPIYTHTINFSAAVNVTMEPGDMVLYESLMDEVDQAHHNISHINTGVAVAGRSSWV